MSTGVSLRRVVALALASGLLSATAATMMRDARPAGAESGDTASFVEAAIDDLQSFWAETMPDVYDQRYEEIPADRRFPYTSQDPPPACGERGTIPYEEVAGNAFYCPEGDFVAWDAEQLIPRLERRFGDFAVALVLAHEWGHAVQARTESTIDTTVYLETQADCFAGAWARHAESGHGTGVHFDASALDAALAGYLAFRDPPGIDPSQDGAHGNGFDRVSAFQDGYERGADRCAEYEQHPPPITESPFTSFQDYSNGGDVSLADTVDLVPADLDAYWAAKLQGRSPVTKLVADGTAGADSCAGKTDGGVLVDGVEYCRTDRTVVYDRDVLAGVYRSTGDFGAGMVLAGEWSAAAQRVLGEPSATTEARLHADCLTGTWAGDVARGERTSGGPRGGRSASGSQLSLSPGDLDEGIATFVSLGGRDEARGSAFGRVAAFRKGFFEGIDACTTITK